MISINTSVVQMVLNNELNKAVKEANIATRNISTGLKVNSPSDNPSTWYIAAKNNIALRGSEAAKLNAKTGANFAQASSVALDDLSDVLTELSNYLNTHSFSTSTINRQQQEAVNGYIEQINNIIASQNINGTDLFVLRTMSDTTNDDNVTFYIGTDPYDTSSISISRALNIGTGTSGSGQAVINLDVKSNASAYNTAKTNVQNMLANVQAKASYDGTKQNIFEDAVKNIDNKIVNLTSNQTTLTSADIAEETVKLSEAQIKQDTITSLMVQNINSLANIATRLVDGLARF